jgi:hypothetical protein
MNTNQLQLHEYIVVEKSLFEVLFFFRFNAKTRLQIENLFLSQFLI